MSLLHYIDNEVPAFGEWDTVAMPGGNATIAQNADSAWPDRGNVGVGIDMNGDQVGYLQKNVSPVQDTITVSVWAKFGSGASDNGGAYFLGIHSGALMLQFSAAGDKYRVHDGTGYCNAWTALPVDVRDDLWHHWVLHLQSGTGDGIARVFLDGVMLGEWTGRTFAGAFARVRVGCEWSFAPFPDGLFCIDEVKISADAAGGYIEPYSPTPTDEYPSAARTVVLYRRDSSDSREFADYCVTKMGVPRANLCPLPNATANETLADYATFQTQVETDLSAWLALNTTVAANCSCFLVACGVPGYFTSGGVKHSATSRLMNLGTAFSSQTANPLYNPATVARLTKTAMGGKYLAMRIDADTLAHAKDILDRAAVVSGLAVLAATDKLITEDSAYKASLACQHLRIDAAGVSGIEFADDAFVFDEYELGYSFGDAGSRAAYVNEAGSSALTLRSTGSKPCADAILTGLYAGAMGNSETADAFDAESFFEMLRIGGTLAEACMVSIANLDYTAVIVGDPLMTAAFECGGYNVYRGVEGAGRESIDWVTPVAYVRPSVSSVDIAQADGTEMWYGLATVSSAGVESETRRTIFAAVDGSLTGPQPNRIVWAAATAAAAGKIELAFQYDSPGAAGVATGVQVARCTGPGEGGADWTSPLQTIAISRDAIWKGQLSPTFADGETVYLAVRAVTAAGDGGVATILPPVVADAAGPTPNTYIEAEQIA